MRTFFFLRLLTIVMLMLSNANAMKRSGRHCSSRIFARASGSGRCRLFYSSNRLRQNRRRQVIDSSWRYSKKCFVRLFSAGINGDGTDDLTTVEEREETTRTLRDEDYRRWKYFRIRNQELFGDRFSFHPDDWHEYSEYTYNLVEFIALSLSHKNETLYDLRSYVVALFEDEEYASDFINKYMFLYRKSKIDFFKEVEAYLIEKEVYYFEQDKLDFMHSLKMLSIASKRVQPESPEYLEALNNFTRLSMPKIGIHDDSSQFVQEYRVTPDSVKLLGLWYIISSQDMDG